SSFGDSKGRPLGWVEWRVVARDRGDYGGRGGALVGDRHGGRVGALVQVGVRAAVDEKAAAGVGRNGPHRLGFVAPLDRRREIIRSEERRVGKEGSNRQRGGVDSNGSGDRKGRPHGSEQ